MRKSKYVIKQTLLLPLSALIILSIFSTGARAADERLCDALGNCLSSSEAAKYRQAEAHISIENWQEANNVLGQLYVESLQKEESANFLVINNYAVTLAKTGRPAVAALVLEKFFKDLPGVGPGFQNLMQTYEFLAASTEPGITPAVDLVLIDPEPVPGGRVMEAAQAEPQVQSSEVNPALNSAISSRLNEYINAWKAGDIEAYLNFYTPDHSPVKGLGYEEWQSQRRTRVRPDRAIEVTISDLRIRQEIDGLVTTVFLQKYQSRYYSDTSRKKLSWTQNTDGSWTIYQEVSIR